MCKDITEDDNDIIKLFHNGLKDRNRVSEKRFMEQIFLSRVIIKLIFELNFGNSYEN